MNLSCANLTGFFCLRRKVKAGAAVTAQAHKSSSPRKSKVSFRDYIY